jgi:hypothetical protein
MMDSGSFAGNMKNTWKEPRGCGRHVMIDFDNAPIHCSDMVEQGANDEFRCRLNDALVIYSKQTWILVSSFLLFGFLNEIFLRRQSET